MTLVLLNPLQQTLGFHVHKSIMLAAKGRHSIYSQVISMNNTKLTSDVSFNLILALISVFFFYQSFHITDDGSLGSSASIPIMACGMMLLSSLITLFKSFKLDSLNKTIIPRTVYFVLISILVYSIAIEVIGFIITSFIFIAVLIFFINKSAATRSIFLSFMVVVITYLVFRIIFKVMLPEGVIPEREILFYLKSVII